MAALMTYDECYAGLCTCLISDARSTFAVRCRTTPSTGLSQTRSPACRSFHCALPRLLRPSPSSGPTTCVSPACWQGIFSITRAPAVAPPKSIGLVIQRRCSLDLCPLRAVLTSALAPEWRPIISFPQDSHGKQPDRNNPFLDSDHEIAGVPVSRLTSPLRSSCYGSAAFRAKALILIRHEAQLCHSLPS